MRSPPSTKDTNELSVSVLRTSTICKRSDIKFFVSKEDLIRSLQIVSNNKKQIDSTLDSISSKFRNSCHSLKDFEQNEQPASNSTLDSISNKFRNSYHSLIEQNENSESNSTLESTSSKYINSYHSSIDLEQKSDKQSESSRSRSNSSSIGSTEDSSSTESQCEFLDSDASYDEYQFSSNESDTSSVTLGFNTIDSSSSTITYNDAESCSTIFSNETQYQHQKQILKNQREKTVNREREKSLTNRTVHFSESVQLSKQLSLLDDCSDPGDENENQNIIPCASDVLFDHVRRNISHHGNRELMVLILRMSDYTDPPHEQIASIDDKVNLAVWVTSELRNKHFGTRFLSWNDKSSFWYELDDSDVNLRIVLLLLGYEMECYDCNHDEHWEAYRDPTCLQNVTNEHNFVFSGSLSCRKNTQTENTSSILEDNTTATKRKTIISDLVEGNHFDLKDENLLNIGNSAQCTSSNKESIDRRDEEELIHNECDGIPIQPYRKENTPAHDDGISKNRIENQRLGDQHGCDRKSEVFRDEIELFKQRESDGEHLAEKTEFLESKIDILQGNEKDMKHLEEKNNFLRINFDLVVSQINKLEEKGSDMKHLEEKNEILTKRVEVFEGQIDMHEQNESDKKHLGEKNEILIEQIDVHEKNECESVHSAEKRIDLMDEIRMHEQSKSDSVDLPETIESPEGKFAFLQQSDGEYLKERTLCLLDQDETSEQDERDEEEKSVGTHNYNGQIQTVTNVSLLKLNEETTQLEEYMCQQDEGECVWYPYEISDSRSIYSIKNISRSQHLDLSLQKEYFDEQIMNDVEFEWGRDSQRKSKKRIIKDANLDLRSDSHLNSCLEVPIQDFIEEDKITCAYLKMDNMLREDSTNDGQNIERDDNDEEDDKIKTVNDDYEADKVKTTNNKESVGKGSRKCENVATSLSTAAQKEVLDSGISSLLKSFENIDSDCDIASIELSIDDILKDTEFVIESLLRGNSPKKIRPSDTDVIFSQCPTDEIFTGANNLLMSIVEEEKRMLMKHNRTTDTIRCCAGNIFMKLVENHPLMRFLSWDTENSAWKEMDTIEVEQKLVLSLIGYKNVF